MNTRLAQTCVLLAILIGWLFGFTLLMFIGGCLAVINIGLTFAKQCDKGWFTAVFGFAVPAGLSLMWTGATSLGATRFGAMFPEVNAADLVDAVNVLGIAYAVSFGLAALALTIDAMGLWTLFACFRHRREDRAKLFTNPFIRAASLAVLGYWTTYVAAYALDYVVNKDAGRVAAVAQQRGEHQALVGAAAVADSQRAAIGFIDFAMSRMNWTTSACGRTNTGELFAVLPSGRVLVSPAVTYREKFESATVHPLADMRIMPCTQTES